MSDRPLIDARTLAQLRRIQRSALASTALPPDKWTIFVAPADPGGLGPSLAAPIGQLDGRVVQVRPRTLGPTQPGGAALVATWQLVTWGGDAPPAESEIRSSPYRFRVRGLITSIPHDTYLLEQL